MTRISSSGIPSERKVKSNISMTSPSDIRLTTMLSLTKVSLKSLAATALPVKYTLPSG